jgi:hypothetical protein
MKLLTITFFLSLSLCLNAQDKIIGRYQDYFGNRIQFNADNTFSYTWNFHMFGSWTKGNWTLKGDTVYLHIVPTYDTLSQRNSVSIQSDSLILSDDEIPERFTKSQFEAKPFLSSGQNRMSYPDKLLFKKGRLYKIKNGKLVIKKQKRFGASKKWNPWYFISDD